MADDSEQIELETEDTPVVVDESDKPADAVADDKEAALADLKAQLAAANSRASTLETQNRELSHQSVTAQAEVQDSNLNLVVNAIGTLKQSQDILKANYAAAMEASDYAAAAEIQVGMAENSAKLLQLEQGKQAMEQAPKPQAAPITDPVEALASQLTPRSAQWVRNNPQYATDPRLYQKMIGAHNIAVADGHAADSDSYFEAVEALLKPPVPASVGNGAVQQDDPTGDAAKPMEARSSPPAAPVSRGGGSGNRVTLSAQEREMAEMMGMTPEEYGKQKLALQKEGKLH